MLCIHFLNVQHGDSAVLQYHDGIRSYFGVVDSNLVGNASPRALGKLRELNAEELSFVCLTHPHKDHYSGLYDILNAFKGRIREFYSFPFGDITVNRKRLKKLTEKYRNLRDSQDDPEVRKAAQEFLQILRFVSTQIGPSNWIECGGENSQIAPVGFSGVIINTILPPRRAKGYYIQQIESGNPVIAENLNDNKLSIAMHISYAGVNVILGGDGTYENWINHQMWQSRASQNIGSAIVKLPHHGAKKDCADDVLENLFCASDKRYGIISANGRTHPSPSVIDWMEKHGVEPFCTNLLPQCGANIAKFINVAGLDPLIARWVREVAEDSEHVQACQGDITVCITQNGDISVVPQYDHPCPCRGGYSQLAQGL